MSLRKSSTWSAEPSLRPRYLGIEVAGVPGFPTPWLQRVLSERLRERRPGSPVRLIRREGNRAVAEVDHRTVPDARSAWNGPVGTGPSPGTIRTVRSWGTLRGAKAWLRTPDRFREVGPPHPDGRL